jgi:TetR/AcrR family transcriptional regulator
VTQTTSRTERRRARTERAIVDAAEAVFREDGYGAATIERIAERADVGIGSIYHHFGSKEGLFLALADRALEVNERYMAEAYDGPGTPLERLLAAAGAYLRFHAEHPYYFRTVALPQLEGRRGEGASQAEARIADRVERLVGTLEELIRQARDAGELRDCDPRLLARFCWAAWNGVIATSLRPDRLRLSPEEVAAVLAEGQRVLVQGLVVGAAP